MSALRARLAAIPVGEWAAWLRAQRWFGAKGGEIGAVQVGALVPIEHDGHAWAIVRLDVRVGDATQRYQLALVDDAAAHGIPKPATQDPAFLRYLADALAHGWSAEGDGVRWSAVPAGSTPVQFPPEAELRVLGAEQSNTSIRLGERAILKLFRRLEAGEHPDVEMTEFLTARHRFAYTPTLLGTLVLEEGGERTVAGMMQELVPGAADAWGYALETATPWFTAREMPRGDPPLAADAAKIGRITRELHETLASDDDLPDFAPEAATGEEVDEWAEATRRQVEEALDLLARQLAGGSGATGIPQERLAEARAILARREHYLSHIEELVDEIGDDAGFITRHHGDYHLGQLLRSSSGEFMIIDFEGEPSRPLAQRRRKASPLRDVAGMLRSFAYAGATLASGAGAPREMGERELRAGRWERAIRGAFLAAYLGEARDEEEDSGVLPEDPQSVKAVLALFEMEKVFYELAYELNNRPAWSWIPMRGIARVTGV